MLFTKRAHRSNKLEEIHGDVIVCNLNCLSTQQLYGMQA